MAFSIRDFHVVLGGGTLPLDLLSENVKMWMPGVYTITTHKVDDGRGRIALDSARPEVK